MTEVGRSKRFEIFYGFVVAGNSLRTFKQKSTSRSSEFHLPSDKRDRLLYLKAS